MPAKRIQPAKPAKPSKAPAAKITTKAAKKKSPYSGLTPPWPYDHHDLHVKLARDAYRRKHGVSAPVEKSSNKITPKTTKPAKPAKPATAKPARNIPRNIPKAPARRRSPSRPPRDLAKLTDAELRKPPYTVRYPGGPAIAANLVPFTQKPSIAHSREWYAAMIARDQAAVRKERQATTAAEARALRKAAKENPASMRAPLATNPDMEYARQVAAYEQAAADLKHWGNLNATDKDASEHQREVYLHHIRDARERMAKAHRAIGLRREKIETKKKRRPARRR